MSNNQDSENNCSSGGSACKGCPSSSSCNLKDSDQASLAGSPRHTVVVMSGKGGVGKSTVAVNLAIALSIAGYNTGLLDIDIHGPSIPTMLRLQDQRTQSENKKILPIDLGNLKVMSIGFLLENNNDAIIWRGPMKTGVIGQFLTDVKWGELDYLIVDAPPGTGDEPLSIFQQLEGDKSALIVTTPQEVAAADVRKSINFCRQMQVAISGIVENMNGFVCPSCDCRTEIFSSGGGEKVANEFNVNFLGSLPIEPGIGKACDQGTPYMVAYEKTVTAQLFRQIVDRLIEETRPEHHAHHK